eukprot:TRINITY_DN12169_c0_g1::TRINITY_DN12169_c0_g1_i1::g.26573::m.26573 TRINITY_DN12169_c0_g1::TRINITY_DN12169_c0_g1_i1::g.26573  ORF type:complete len:272 (+),score=47.35,sp/Q5ZJN1/RTF2_CHICK/44.50/1e-39,Rtf2/PF04641.7/2.9e-69,DUF2256/PF10013.4/0.046,Effector_1/PF04518.7/0.029,TF_Zn_Ribbon/PF08271.7/4.3e+02,TF_Zn_Ribbon/PF08271.7/33,TF_Zn_Ribbon/PF08271.7/21 TRINITY_DN12169_c0_g1_i1:68-883(+)
MGGDGGSIPGRMELVDMYARDKPTTVDPNEAKKAKWRTCHFSNETLKEPIVVDELGRFYNKEALIEALLRKDDKLKLSDYSHLSNLRDLISLKLTKNPAAAAVTSTKKEKLDTYDTYVNEFICPVTLIEMSGKCNFVAIRSCGCVLAERVLKEIPSKTCPNCQQPFDRENDVIHLNASGDELEKAKTRLATKLAQRKDKKKDKRTAENDSDNPAKKAKVQSVNLNALPGASAALIKDKQAPKASTSDVYNSLFNRKDAKKETAKDLFFRRG